LALLESGSSAVTFNIYVVFLRRSKSSLETAVASSGSGGVFGATFLLRLLVADAANFMVDFTKEGLLGLSSSSLKHF
jgi:hypothetical protein